MCAARRLRFRLLLLILSAISGAILLKGREAYAQSWVVAVTPGTVSRATKYLKEDEVTPWVKTNVPNASAYYNKAARLFIRVRERVMFNANLHATYGGMIVCGYEAFPIGSLVTNGMTKSEILLASKTNGIQLKAGYYRARIYYGEPSPTSDEWVTVFRSGDKQRLVILPDSGPLYVSENFGASWKSISTPGDYECTLSQTPKGSVFVAVISVGTPADTNASAKRAAMTTKKWYSVASATDGTQLVLTGGAAQAAPALSIMVSDGKAVVTWPASFTGFVLQQATDPTTADWQDVTDEAIVTNNEFQVTTTAVKEKGFFRLIKR